ncbi:MAG: aminotransferase class I/II-fold pyridoxal phosphate-dependent enzyme [Flavobacterium sp.]|jgi:LL-diaminopimelate aminotransferase|nr:aminotransferase class I/II-fold pyridoxal phosphate-dependent enzyme [Flavobacterium sp.]MBT6377850.1 aminotransferase class I/II-fold pyridoxal phosphate-dependent enzyme [Flavobacterium sp.]MBT6882323.1 aminotransferase class I/II-fold pyridoxal phosphate-dependent enzyme [Flavobacterium sp.]MBT7424560.1 aminotransferase class I/II-fold pyridoxal phosphate-dependent enzyme [Flavobacterium sp.]
MMKAAKRLDTVQEYYFSKKLREVRALSAQGKPIINMGIGSPDLQPPPAVIEAIQQAVLQEGAHKYQSYQGLPAFRQAVADFYQKNYQVVVNPENEILPLMGSKEGILHISMAFLNKGDQVLIPNPGYPTYTSVTNLVEAVPVFYDLTSEHNWEPNFKQLEQKDLSNVKLMWVNYPHMPTGAKATENLFKKLIAFGKKHQLLIINDNPYSFVLNNNPLSILSIDGAKETAIELNSLSKSFNMAGWRVGMLLGATPILEEVLKVKTQMDSGMFYGIQQGAIAALKVSSGWFENMNEIYQKRRKLIWQIAEALDCTFDKNTSGMFVWAKIPAGKKAENIVDDLLYKHHIFIAPGTIFGSKGEGYIRFSLCVPEEKIKEALDRL